METKPLLLVAEDDPDDQYLIRYAIETGCRPQIETRYAWDGVELLSILAEQVQRSTIPDLVVLDLNMPRKDGRETLKAIRDDPQLAEIPVAILSTSGARDDVRFCRSLGVVEYYCKPSSISELRAIFDELCRTYLS